MKWGNDNSGDSHIVHSEGKSRMKPPPPPSPHLLIIMNPDPLSLEGNPHRGLSALLAHLPSPYLNKMNTFGLFALRLGLVSHPEQKAEAYSIVGYDVPSTTSNFAYSIQVFLCRSISSDRIPFLQLRSCSRGNSEFSLQRNHTRVRLELHQRSHQTD